MDNENPSPQPPSAVTHEALRDPSTAYQAAAANRNWAFAATATGVKCLALAQHLNRSQLRMNPFDCGHVDQWLSPKAVHLVNSPEPVTLCLDCLLKEITQLTGAEIHPEFHTSKAEFFADTLSFGPLAEARYYTALLEFYFFLRLPRSHAFHARLDKETALLFVVWAQLSDVSARNWLAIPHPYTLADSSLQFLATLMSVKGVFEPDYLAEVLGLSESD